MPLLALFDEKGRRRYDITGANATFYPDVSSPQQKCKKGKAGGGAQQKCKKGNAKQERPHILRDNPTCSDLSENTRMAAGDTGTAGKMRDATPARPTPSAGLISAK